MLNDDDIALVREHSDSSAGPIVLGVPLVWIIDGDCLYDLPMTVEHSQIFQNADRVIDISNDYPDHEGIVVRLLKDGNILEEIKTSEYFGSILLSDPLVVNLTSYPYGRYVQSPHATFDGVQFHITDRDVSQEYPWPPGYEPSGE